MKPNAAPLEPDGFAALAEAIWPLGSPESELALHATCLRPILAELLRSAGGGTGTLPLASLHLSAEECAAISQLPNLFAQEENALLLPRYASQIRQIRHFFNQRLAAHSPQFNDADLRQHLNTLLPAEIIFEPGSGRKLFDNAQQRLAIAALADATVGVLTGGPGTGKTTTAAVLLALIHRFDPKLTADQVIVAAPTGKAACRIGEALSRAAAQLSDLTDSDRSFLQSIRPTTLHRALEWGPLPPEKGGPFRRNASRPFEARIVLVDESSMIDLSLMHALTQATPASTALLLLGDSDQLESVDVGGILSECVQRAGLSSSLPVELLQRLENRLGKDVAQVQADFETGLPRLATTHSDPLTGLVFGLKDSWRAMHTPWILEFAEQVRPGQSGTINQVNLLFERPYPNGTSPLRWHKDAPDLARKRVCLEQWTQWATQSKKWNLVPKEKTEVQLNLSAEALTQLGAFQLLCSTNAQVERANAEGTALLWTLERRHPAAIPHGCPIIILANHRSLGLNNGDTGIALGEFAGGPALIGLFPESDGSPRLIPLAQLPAHQAAFGLTIHKSQGSEWKHIGIELPSDTESRMLTRNLLYTGITRSKGEVDLFGSSESLEAVMGTEIKNKTSI